MDEKDYIYIIGILWGVGLFASAIVAVLTEWISRKKSGK